MSISYGKKVGITLLSFSPANRRGFVIMLSLSISLSLDEGNTTQPNSLGDLRQQSRSWTYARIVGERKESEQAHSGGYGRTGEREGSREDGHADSRCRGEHATAKELKSRRARSLGGRMREDEGGRRSSMAFLNSSE